MDGHASAWSSQALSAAVEGGHCWTQAPCPWVQTEHPAAQMEPVSLCLWERWAGTGAWLGTHPAPKPLVSLFPVTLSSDGRALLGVSLCQAQRNFPVSGGSFVLPHTGPSANTHILSNLLFRLSHHYKCIYSLSGIAVLYHPTGLMGEE